MKGRDKWERLPIYWFMPQVPAVDSSGPGQSQEPRTLAAGSLQVTGSSFAVYQDTLGGSWIRSWVTRTFNRHSGTGCGFTCWATSPHPPMYFSNGILKTTLWFGFSSYCMLEFSGLARVRTLNMKHENHPTAWAEWFDFRRSFAMKPVIGWDPFYLWIQSSQPVRQWEISQGRCCS